MIYTFLSIYLSEKIGLTTTELTLMASIPMIVSALSQSFIWGPLLDKIQKSHIFIIAGEIIAGILHLVMYYMHNIALDDGNLRFAGYVIILNLVIIEFPWSASNVGWSALISEKTKDDERTQLMAQLSFIGGFGGIFGAQTGGYLYENGKGFSEGSIFFLAAAIIIFSSIIIIFTLKSDMKSKSKENINEKGVKENFKSLYPERNYPFYLYLFALVLIVFGINGVWMMINLYLAEDSGFNAGGSKLALFSNVRMISVMISGLVLGSKHNKRNDWLILKLGVIVSILGLFFLIIAPTFNFTLIGATLLGLQIVMIQSASYGIVAKIIPMEFRGQLFGYYNSVFFLSFGFAGTFFFGPLVDLIDYFSGDLSLAYRSSFLAAIFLILIGMRVLSKAKCQIEKIEFINND